MNRYNRAIIAEFTSGENREFIKTSLVNYFNNPKVFKYVNDNVDDMINHFTEKTERDMMLSDPIGKKSIYEQVVMLNRIFLSSAVNGIKTECYEEAVPKFGVSDGVATSRHSVDHFQKSSDDILDTWRANRKSAPMHIRDDNHGDEGQGMNNLYYNGGLQTGVIFCDQSDLNTSQHVDRLLNTQYVKGLNGPVLYNGYLGDGSAETDAKLLQRRVFRNGHGTKTENGLNTYELRLQRRNLDRDLKESLAAYEKDFILQKHDMESLHNRVDDKVSRRITRHQQQMNNQQMQYS
jgi:hypothetical protein